MRCELCISQKGLELSVTRCKVCGNWRPLNDAELARVSKRAPLSDEEKQHRIDAAERFEAAQAEVGND